MMLPATRLDSRAKPGSLMNHLYYGDNLKVLRESIKDDSVDLIYLDPPFNSNASYNQLFKAPDGSQSAAQSEAFTDTWQWGPEAEQALIDVQRSSFQDAAQLLTAMFAFLGKNAMSAYLTMMAVRLVELHRVLKPTGSLYLHCDPTASHYLKILLDAVFGAVNFGNEISWRRSNPKSLSSRNFANCRDIILRYTKTGTALFIPQYGEHDESYVAKAYSHTDLDGRKYQLLPLLNPNDNRPNLKYEFLGVTRVWRWTKERMQKAYDEGIVVQVKQGSVPRYKKFIEDSKGRTISNDWHDIQQIGAKEGLGYPTQKPVALLERILNASSNPGDVVLDPFCGCGTTVHAAQKLGRRWIGIDVTHLAIDLIEKRLRGAFEGVQFTIHGTPTDLAGAQALAAADKYEFEKWALPKIGAQPANQSKKGADRGLDGVLWFGGSARAIVSVKGGANISVPMIRDLIGTVEREKAQIGVFLTLEEPTKPMVREAAEAGMYSPEGYDNPVPRIQIVTIAQALALRDRAVQIPLRFDSYKKAAPEVDVTSQGKLEL